MAAGFTVLGRVRVWGVLVRVVVSTVTRWGHGAGSAVAGMQGCGLRAGFVGAFARLHRAVGHGSAVQAEQRRPSPWW